MLVVKLFTFIKIKIIFDNLLLYCIYKYLKYLDSVLLNFIIDFLIYNKITNKNCDISYMFYLY